MTQFKTSQLARLIWYLCHLNRFWVQSQRKTTWPALPQSKYTALSQVRPGQRSWTARGTRNTRRSSTRYASLPTNSTCLSFWLTTKCTPHQLCTRRLQIVLAILTMSLICNFAHKHKSKRHQRQKRRQTRQIKRLLRSWYRSCMTMMRKTMQIYWILLMMVTSVQSDRPHPMMPMVTHLIVNMATNSDQGILSLRIIYSPITVTATFKSKSARASN